MVVRIPPKKSRYPAVPGEEVGVFGHGSNLLLPKGAVLKG
jgi:hypothetical protein